MKYKDQDWPPVDFIVNKAAVMKKQMEQKGLTRAKAKCPFEDCNGHWHAILAGPKKHLHFKCDGECNSFMMT